MTDRIDHAAKARQRIAWTHDWQEQEGSTPEAGIATALIAQVRAFEERLAPIVQQVLI